MKLLLISNLYPPKVLGGFEIAARDLAVALTERGHEVRVLTSPADTAVSTDDAVDVRRVLRLIPFGSPATHPAVAELRNFESAVSQQDNSLIVIDSIEDFQPDHVVLFNVIGLGGLGLIDVLHRSGRPWSANLGDSVPLTLVDGVDPAVLNVYGIDPHIYFSTIPIIAVSEKVIDEIEHGGVGLSKDRLVIPRGVRVANEDLVRSDSRVRRAKTTFVFAGTLHPHKGLHLVLEAASTLGRSDFVIEVFGSGLDDMYAAMATEMQVDHLVRFHGQVERHEIFATLSEADAFLFPTWEREPLGQAPFQAASLGCVPILTAQSGAAEWLTHGVHCVKIERRADSLSEAMAFVLDNRDQTAAMGRRARSYVETEYSFVSYISRTIDFLGRHAATAAAAAPMADVRRETIELHRRSQAIMHERLRNEERLSP
jgi:glycogen(starch) synthase